MKSKLENKTNKSPNEQAGKLGASKLVPAKSDNPINGNWWAISEYVVEVIGAGT